MSSGFAIYRANGSVLLSSDSYGAVFVEVLNVPAGAAFTKSYPVFVGRQFRVINTRTYITISYPGGIPTITVDAASFGTAVNFYVFAL